MLSIKLNKIVAWILLAYVALFIVPPISTFAGSHQKRDAVFVENAGPVLEQARCQAPLLLFDVLLWQNLKKTKLSEEFLAVDPGHDKQESARIQTSDTFALIQSQSALFRHGRVTGTASAFHQSRSSSIRFTKSGISPPVFSL